ncbi:microfibril-associated glycoprotein 4-like [Colossoma macropomum]|uniref:microfibril-associated glycoprotein 4-like n=1 Tax=Colossoma macropomum TaxID=42526 RepID=UPI00186523F9|nr:microfibril-associated glycoprotein 4-like [Colossoma macropomum]XP_036413592.1 microfibril-associated glycoprotein 4-like [Colossoma macropomum]
MHSTPLSLWTLKLMAMHSMLVASSMEEQAFAALLFLLPVAVHSQLSLPLDCADIQNHDNRQPSGVYTIFPIGSTSAVRVYCDMDTDGGGWTVFQRRLDGSVNFYRGWDQYKAGFGFADGEYWLGLESLFHLTLRKKYELRVDMEDWEGGRVFAHYSSFSVDPESFGYTLYVSGFSDGGAGDSLSGHSGQKFSTFDKDQDSSENNCAKLHRGAFWYSDCHAANPNGLYLWGSDKTHHATGVEWRYWKGNDYSLKTIGMKIRPVSSAI